MSYKRVVIEKFGGPEVLSLVEESSLPEPGPNEVRVKVLATSANFTDVMIRKGMYPEVKQKPPFSPGYDMVGVVDGVGENVTRFREGDKVADMTVIGSYSEYICVPEKRLIHVPEALDPAEATSIILSYVTAWQMLHRIAKIRKGQKILVHGAGGAVGMAMLQLGKLMELEMYGTASESKHDMIKAAGAIPIDYKTTDFADYIKKHTEVGLDAVFDPIGGDNFRKSFSILRKGGKLVAYGFYNAVMGHGGSIPMDFMKLQLWNILPNGKSTTFYPIGGDNFRESFSILRKGGKLVAYGIFCQTENPPLFIPLGPYAGNIPTGSGKILPHCLICLQRKGLNPMWRDIIRLKKYRKCIGLSKMPK